MIAPPHFDEENENVEILVVDDCQMNILAVHSLLNQFGYESSYCIDGQEAIEAISTRLA